MGIFGLSDSDMEELRKMSAQFGATPEDRVDANKQAMVMLGLGLLQGRKGQELATIGQAGTGALGYRSGLLADIPKQRLESLGGAAKMMSMAEQLRTLKDQQEFRNWQQPPAQSSAAASPSGPPVMGAEGGFSVSPPFGAMPSPTVQSVPAVAGQQFDPATMLMDQIKQYDAGYKQTRNPAFLKARDQAIAEWQKIRDEYGTPQVGMVGGKPTFTRYGKYGGQQSVAGVEPPPEITYQDTGGGIRIGNKLTEVPGTMIPKAMTPGEVAANRIAAGHLAVSQAAEKRAAEAAGVGGKPTWDTSSGSFIYPPSATMPTGRVVQPEGYAKVEKPLTESQAKATAYANQMSNATTILSELDKEGFSGKGTAQQVRITAAGAEGVPYVPGSAAIPRMLSGDQAQKYDQAKLQWTEAALRFMTGANAPEQEVRRNAMTYFPLPGDSPAKIEQKAQMRQAMEESIRMASGAGIKKLSPTQNSSGKGVSSVRTQADRILAGE